MKSRTMFTPRLEPLDHRTLPSMMLSGGVLTVLGTGGADQIRVSTPGAGLLRVTINTTGENRLFSTSRVGDLHVRTGGGDDLIALAAGVTVRTDLRGGAGNDRILGGNGADDVFGGAGNDLLVGRGGNDDLHGDDGNDDVRGGGGDDRIDGGRGRDNCDGQGGADDVVNGMDRENELFAPLTGTGTGSAKFEFQQSPAETEREFEVEVEDLTPGTTATVVVDGVAVGNMTINSLGRGRLKLELDFDRDDNGTRDFPPNFPEIHAGSTIEIRVNGSVVLSGTFS